jgi:hypothetical protein
VKRLLLSRGFVLTLLAALTALIVVASLLPQSFLTSPDDLATWARAHPVLARAAAGLGLHHVYTHPAFTGALLLAVVALCLSTGEQVRAALRRVSRGGAPGGARIESDRTPDEVLRTLRARGYLALGGGAGARRLVRQPWGYFGNTLLHGGLTVAVAASAYIGVTQQRGLVHLLEGDTHRVGGPWFVEENGVGASRLVLPFSVRLDHVALRSGPSSAVESAVSTLTLERAGAPRRSVRVGIGDLQEVDGVTIYQGAELGHAFRVVISSGDRDVVRTLLVRHPATPDEEGTNEFRGLLPGGEVLRAKYLVDADRQSFEQFNPVLFLRVDGPGGDAAGQAELRPGTSATAGAYGLRLEKVSVWTRLVFVRAPGMAGVFAGFFIIALGGVLHYFTAPREATLEERGPGATLVTWRAARFASFYAEELDELRAALARGGEA